MPSMYSVVGLTCYSSNYSPSNPPCYYRHKQVRGTRAEHDGRKYISATRTQPDGREEASQVKRITTSTLPTYLY